MISAADLPVVIPGQAPDFLVGFNAAVPLSDLNAAVQTWRARRMPHGLLELSEEEVLYVGRSSSWPDVVSTLFLLKGLRTSIRAQEMRGYAAVLDSFSRYKSSLSLSPSDIVWCMHQDFGGVFMGAPGAYTLLMPGPFGEWAITDGRTLRRSEANVLAYPRNF